MQLTALRLKPEKSVDFPLLLEELRTVIHGCSIEEACAFRHAGWISIYLAGEQGGQSDITESLRTNRKDMALTTVSERHERQAVRQFYEEYLGKDSLFIGERSVQTALNVDFRKSMQNGLTGAVFRELRKTANLLGDTIRSSGELSAHSVTPESLSRELAGKIMEDVSEAVITVIGANESSERFLEYWSRQHVRRLYYCHPDFSEAERLSLTLEALPIRPEEVGEALSQSDIIIIASKEDDLLAPSQTAILSSLHTQRKKHRLIYNWGELPEVTATFSRSSSVFVYNREELEQALMQAREKRRQILTRFQQHIDEMVEGFFDWLYSDQRYRFQGIVGKSHQMQQVFDLIERVAETDITVLIQGETGTGKELVARAIHEISQRKNGPFVTINCGAIPETLLEAELFGHEKGAFTGATSPRKGLLKEAAGGTVFLDEIGDTTQMFQVKLLRALQEREVTPLGSSTPESIDVRIIAATSKRLQAEVETGHFRSDLYYRINVVQLSLPPLCERKEDIFPLINHFMRKYNTKMGKQVEVISKEAAEALIAYEWQGNIRELENVVERAIALSADHRITRDDLPASVVQPTAHTAQDRAEEIRTLEEVEEQYIRQLLQQLQGNYSEVAEKLGIGRTTLWRKIKKYGLEEEE